MAQELLNTPDANAENDNNQEQKEEEEQEQEARRSKEEIERRWQKWCPRLKGNINSRPLGKPNWPKTLKCLNLKLFIVKSRLERDAKDSTFYALEIRGPCGSGHMAAHD
ncbi:Hypothetical predicted protein [Olea europaea subsp. europaea]|uniref:Uncharacterized protein n=1 Tax=Olea europaea subsp. europaea TaxID=158383 RepID=A0A8S0PCV4_OLEEU|nr:Hypothetical predicted protein [Olea europaea subsp. europaea]